MTTAKEQKNPENAEPQEVPACFIIMPISNQPDYQDGHFTRVYQDIISPAVAAGGYRAVRADQDRAANMIHLEILRQLINSPMAICDVSSLNPNVMFELGIRQAFDKPVVLMKDNSTRNPFDISIIRYVDYDETMQYRTVLSAVADLTEAIIATKALKRDESVNSIIRLLGLQAAAMQPSNETPETARVELFSKMFDDISSELRAVRVDLAKMQTEKTASAVTNKLLNITRASIDESALKSVNAIWPKNDGGSTSIKSSIIAEEIASKIAAGTIPASFIDKATKKT